MKLKSLIWMVLIFALVGCGTINVPPPYTPPMPMKVNGGTFAGGGLPSPGIGKCPPGFVVNQLIAGTGPPQGCISASTGVGPNNATSPPFNADSTGIIDATAAIQACTNASDDGSTTSPTATNFCYLPHGDYKTTFPLVERAQAGTLAGDPSNMWGPVSKIHANGLYPVIFQMPGGTSTGYLSNLGTISGAALVGSGNSAVFNAGKPWWINLGDILIYKSSSDDSCARLLNGRSTLLIQGYAKTPASGAFGVGGSIVGNGSVTASPGLFQISGTVGTSAIAYLRMSSGLVGPLTVNTAAANTTYWYALQVSGNTVSFYWGVPGGSITPQTLSTSGTTAQASNEEDIFGGLPQAWLGSNLATPMVGGLDSINIENATSYSGVQTAPNAKFVFSGTTTLYLNNFTHFQSDVGGDACTTGSPCFISADAVDRNALTTSWHPIYNPTFTGSITAQTVQDIETTGGSWSLMAAMDPFSDATHMYAFDPARGLYQYFNNTFSATGSHLNGIPLCGDPDYAFDWGVNKFQTLNVTGGLYQYAFGQTGGGILDNAEGAGALNTIANFYSDTTANANTDIVLNAPEPDNENPSANTTSVLLDGNLAKISINTGGGTLIGVGTGPAIQVNGRQVPQMVLNNATLSPGASASAAIVLPTMSNLTNPGRIVIDNVTNTSTTIPLTNRFDLLSTLDSTNSGFATIAHTGAMFGGIVYQGCTPTANAITGTTFNLNNPSCAQPHEMEVAVVCAANSPTINTPTGPTWTQLFAQANTGDSNEGIKAFYHEVTGADGATTFTVGSSNNFSAAIFPLTGINLSNPVDTSANAAHNFGAGPYTVTPAGPTAAFANAPVLTFACANGAQPTMSSLPSNALSLYGMNNNVGGVQSVGALFSQINNTTVPSIGFSIASGVSASVIAVTASMNPASDQTPSSFVMQGGKGVKFGDLSAPTLLGSGTPGIAGGGTFITGANSFVGTISNIAATLNILTPGFTCPNKVVLLPIGHIDAAFPVASTTTTATFSGTAGDTVDYLTSCR